MSYQKIVEERRCVMRSIRSYVFYWQHRYHSDPHLLFFLMLLVPPAEEFCYVTVYVLRDQENWGVKKGVWMEAESGTSVEGEIEMNTVDVQM